MQAVVKSRRKLYEGKAKVIYEGPEPGTVIQYFKDEATAFNAKKKGTVEGKGIYNNRISEYFMTALEAVNVPTHFIRGLNMREQLVRKVEIIPIEIVVRNVAAGSFCKRFGAEEGMKLPRAIVEHYYKSDELDDPMITEEHIMIFNWATPQELDEMVHLTLRINDFLCGILHAIDIRLIDFKLEFGRYWQGDEMRVVLADEISPDTCRLWDMKTDKKLDKDRFRHDLDEVAEAYAEVARRLGVSPKSGPKLGVVANEDES